MFPQPHFEKTELPKLTGIAVGEQKGQNRLR